MITDPNHPDYDAAARDAAMDLAPFYDPNYKCEVVRAHVFRGCLSELRERERLALERVKRLDALSSAGMVKILDLTARQLCDRCGEYVDQCSCAYAPRLGDGKRFHWRRMNPGSGECLQVYAEGLAHWAFCDTEERATIVVDALEAFHNSQQPTTG